MKNHIKRTTTATALSLFAALILTGVALAANNGQLSGSGSISGEPVVGGDITFDISVVNDPSGVGVFFDDRLYNISGVVNLPPNLSLKSCSLTPSATLQNTPSAGYTQIRFDNIKNLEVDESVSVSCSATLAPTIQIGDTFSIDYRWEAYTNPCESCVGEWRYFPGPTPNDFAPISATAQAFDLEKSSATTTGEAQVNGAGGYEPAPAPGHGAGPDWPYTYTLTLTNNPLNPVSQAKIFDIVPPGVAYLGNDTITCSLHGAPATQTPIRTLSDGSLPNTVDGSLVLEWDLDAVFASTTMLLPGETCIITYETAIPYRERRFADGVTVGGGPFSGPIAGSPDATHQNNYTATGNYEDPVNGPIAQIDGSTPGATPADDAPVSVHSSYHSITKSSGTSTVYQDTVVNYTVRGYISEYTDFTASAITPYVITDVIPDGLEFCSRLPGGDTNGYYDLCPFTATPALFNGAPLDPASVTPSGGDLLVTWNVTDPSTVQAGDTWTLTYKAVVRDFYSNGLPVSGLDVRPNDVTASGEWNDLVSPGRTGTDTTHATSSIQVGSPSIDKTIWNPTTSQWVQGPVTLEIGQDFKYKIELNFDDDLDMRNVIIDDVMPMAQHYIPNSAGFTGSQGYADTVPPNTPQTAQGDYNGTTFEVEQAQNLDNFRIDFCPYNDTLSRVDGDPSDPFLTVLDLLGGRQRLEWFLCRIDNSDTGNTIIWQTDFRGVVVDDPEVYNGCQVNNFGMLSGTNSFGTTYSLRDNLTAVYAVPNLVMRKVNTAPDPLYASGPFDYTLSVENDGGIGTVGNAYDWTIKDIIPAGLRVPASGGVCSSFSTTAPGDYACIPDAGAQAGTGGFVTIIPVDGLGAQDPTRAIPPATRYNFTFRAEMTDVSPGAATADEALFNTASVEYCTRPMPLDMDSDGSADRRCTGYLANTIPHSDAGGSPTFDAFRDYVETDDTAPNGNEIDNTDTSRVHIGAVAATKTHIAPAHAAPQVTTGDFATIGEVYQVTLDISIPARTILYASPTSGYVDTIDTITSEGVSFCDSGDGIAGCADPIITQSGTIAAPDTTHGASAPDWWQVNATTPNPGSTVHFYLQDLDNSAGTSAYDFTITFTMTVTGKNDSGGAVFFLPTTNDVVSNRFVLDYFNDDATPVEFITTPAADSIHIDQPHITTDKEATSITRPGIGVLCSSAATCDSVQVQGNDIVTYSMTYANDGESTAFDVSMIDDLTVYATYNNDMVCTSDTAVPISGGVVGSSPAASPYTTELAIDTTPAGQWDLPPGRRVSCLYTITVEPNVPAGTTLSNFTDADWSTLDGSAPGERVFDDRDVNGDGTANDDGPDDQDIESLQVAIPVAGKIRLAPAGTGAQDVRIGDVIDYQITIPLPIGRTQDLVITDLPDPGLIFYEGGTLTVRTNTLNPLTYTQTLTGTNDGIGAFSVAWTVWDPACTPVAGAAHCIYNDGTNNTAVTIDLQMIVADVPLNINGLVLDNRMSAAFRDGLGNARTINDGGPLNDEEVLIREPHITTTKSAAPSPADAGDVLTYTVTMTNDGTATAYDVSFDENLDDHTDFDTATPITCSDSISGATSSQLDISPFDGTADAPTVGMDVFRIANNLSEAGNGWDLATGESISCTYRVTLLDTVGPGFPISNRVDADWSSLDGPVSGGPTAPNEREYDDHDRDTSVDTNGNGNPADDDDDATGFLAHSGLDDQATSLVPVPAPTVAKSRTSGADAQPGELVTYQVVVTLPEGTTTGLSIRDTLPTGFQFVSTDSVTAGWVAANPSYPLPGFSAQPAAGATGTLTWTFDPSNPVLNPGDNVANNTITLGYTVRVTSSAASGVNTNTAQASYTNFVGGTSPTNSSTATVNVIRPTISVSKTSAPAAPTTVDAGDTVLYTVTIRNTRANTIAYDVFFNENLSNNTDYDPSYPMSCVQNGSTPLTFQMDDLSDGFDTTADTFTPGLDQFRIAGALAEASNPWSLDFNETIACTYRVIVLDSLPAGATGASAVQNSVTGTFDSADGVATGQQSFSQTRATTLNARAPVFTSKTRTSPAPGVKDTAQPGDLVSYQIVVTVPEGTTGGLEITDTLPAGFEFVSTGPVTAGWGESLPGFTSPPIPGATGTLTWTFSSSVVNPGDNAANNTITLGYTVRVTPTAVVNITPLNDGNDSLNTGAASYIPFLGSSTPIGGGTALIDVIRPVLSISKTVSPAAPNRVDAGDVLTYTVTMSNGGPGTAYDLYFDENLDDATDYVIPSTLTCTHSASGPLTAQIDESPFDGAADAALNSMDIFRIAGALAEASNPWVLAPNESITCSYQVVANQDAPASDSIDNTVTAHGDSADGVVTGQESITTPSATTALLTPDASIAKDNDTASGSYHADDVYVPGDLAPYVLTVTAPEGSIRNLVVCDNLAPQMGYDSTVSIANSDGMVYSVGTDYSILTAGFPAACPAGTDVAYQFASPLVLDNVANADNATPGGDFKTITIRYLARVLATATDGQTLTNTATLAYTRGDTGATRTTTDSETIRVAVVTQDTDKAITTIHRGSSDLCTTAAGCDSIEVIAGDVLTYSLSVTNTHASATAYDVTMSDSLPTALRYNGDLTCGRVPGGSIPTTPPAAGSNPVLADAAAIGAVNLAPGEALACTYSATVQTSVTAAEILTNTATGSVTTASGTPTGDRTITDTAADTATAAAIDLQLGKSVDHPQANAADTVVFTLTLNNLGPSPASGVTVKDSLPAGFAFISASPAADYDSGSGLWTVGNLAAGSSTQLQITATLAAVGPYANYAQVLTANQPDVDSTPGDDSTAQDDDDTVTIDILPKLDVTKSVSPDNLPEAGGDVTFTITVTNTSAEPETLTTLSDDIYGNLNGQGDCVTPQTLATDATYTCTFTKTIPPTPGVTHTDTVTATVRDTQNNTASDSASATVDVIDVKPGIIVQKAASATTINEPGGNITFTISVQNTSVEDDVLTVLSDDIFGDLNGVGTCATGGTILAGATYTCTFTRPITGPGGTVHTDTVSGTLRDNENNTADASDSATVTILDVIRVTKTALPVTVPEPGAPVTFTVSVQNVSGGPVTLTSLNDDIFGDLDGVGDCATGGTIAAGGTYSCTFTRTISGNAGAVHHDTVTATVTDGGAGTASDSDDATVTVTDVLPTITVSKTVTPGVMSEPGGNASFTVVVTNTSPEALTLTALDDDQFGDLFGLGLCTAPSADIPAGGSYSCTFTGAVSGDVGPTHTHVDTVTATAHDDDNGGNPVTARASAEVSFTDIIPTIDVVKTANPTTVSAPGGNVDFTVAVINTSPEPVTLVSLIDDVYGDLSGDCPVFGTILPGDTFSCTFTRMVSGAAGSTHQDTVSAEVNDNEGNPANGQDSATVTIADSNPSVTVIKTANPTTVAPPGGDVTFTVEVRNTSAEAESLTSLVDSIYGDLDGVGDCVTGNPIAAGNTYTCTFTRTINGSEGDTHTNVVTVTVTDSGSKTATDQDSETVTISDTPAITINVVKTASPTTVSAPGGDVDFTVEVTNTSPVPVDLTSLTDDVYGDLSGDCPAFGTILPGDTYRCTFTRTVSGAAGSTHQDTVTATAENSGGTPASGQDSATVSIVGTSPSVEVIKTANPTTLPGLSGDVTFTVEVRNTSAGPVSLISLADSVYGDLFGTGLCTAPSGDIAAGDSYTCAFTRTISGSAGDVHTNVVTATVTDSQDQTASSQDTAWVTIQDVLPSIAVSKTPDTGSVPEPGGTVTFTVVVTNTSGETVTLTSLSDNVFGTPSGAGECSVPQTIGAAGSYTCRFTRPITGDANDTHTDTITTTADDNHGHSVTRTASANVDITDALPSITVSKTPGVSSINEPGGMVSYTVVVTNTSVEPVTLSGLVDDRFGDLFGLNLCTAPSGDIPVGGNYSCTFQGNVTGAVGSIHTNTITATAHDNEDHDTTGSDSADVLIADVIDVSKSPSTPSLSEPGGDVTFTVIATNLSGADITLDNLTDDVFGDLNGQGTCATGGTIAAAGQYSCTFTRALTGEPSTPHSDTVTASVTDSSGNPASDSDDATVSFSDVRPAISVVKTATPTAVFEPGGSVTFTVDVHNSSVEPVRLDTLSDNVFGNLSGAGTCATGGTIAAGGTYTCSFTRSLSGNAGDTHTDTVSATASDNETNSTPASDDATVTFSPTADLELTKTASDSTPDIGTTVTFTLTLTNHGPSSASNVTVTDPLPAGYTASGSTPSQGAYDGGTGLWTVGDLSNGQTVSLTIDALVGPAGPYDNYAEITHSDQHDSDSTPGNGSIDEDDDDTVAMTPVAGCVSGVLYLDENRNGIQDSGEGGIPNVRLQLFRGSTAIAVATTDSNGVYTFPVVPTGTYSVEIDQTTLPAGVPVYITPGDARQDVVVSVGGTCASGNYGLLITDPVITKRGSPSQADRGETVTFTIQVTNTSSTTAMNNVVVNDPLNGYFVYVSSTTTQGTASYNSSTHVVTFDLGTLGTGATATLTVRVRISSSAPRPSTIPNLASVTFEDGAAQTSPVVQTRVPRPSSSSGGSDDDTSSSSTSSSSASVTATTTTTTSGPTLLPNTGERDSEGGGPALSLLSIIDLALILPVGMALTALFTLSPHLRGIGRKTRPAILITLFTGVIAASLVFSSTALRTHLLPAGPQLEQAARPTGPSATPPAPAQPTATPALNEAAPAEAAPAEEAAPETLGQVAPGTLAKRLLIPSIKVDAAITTAPVAGPTWDMSGLHQEIGYLDGTAYPGGPGNAVLAGHVTLKGGINGPFVRLRELNPGDIVVAQDDATDYVYRVAWIKEVDEAAIEVTAPTDIPSMTLITCTQWSVDLHAYTKRLIVRAELFEQHRGTGG